MDHNFYHALMTHLDNRHSVFMRRHGYDVVEKISKVERENRQTQKKQPINKLSIVTFKTVLLNN